MPSLLHQPSDNPLNIVAVAVLYKRTILESESVSSLLDVLKRHPEWRAHFSLVLYDNSPEPQPVPSGLPIAPLYIHDKTNGGLAPAYQRGLEHATAMGTQWLLLLDQDTVLTEEFLAESLRTAGDLQRDTAIGGIVPKLVAKGTIYSPEADYLYQLRHQFRTVRHPVPPDAFGVQAKPTSAYNSGALLRVSALQTIGGFPPEFWLDYLDHAVFQELYRHGFRIHVMRASLEQNLSHMDVNDVPHWRHRSVLTAQTRFVRRYGKWGDRLLFRLYLLRTCRFLFKKCRNRYVWKEMLVQSLILPIPSVRLGRSSP